jgi:hypothetical protein
LTASRELVAGLRLVEQSEPPVAQVFDLPLEEITRSA